jgi:N-formylglutamate deformylase
MKNDLFTLHQGSRPLLVSVPHSGIQIPTALQPLYSERALEVEDTDWFLGEIYAFVKELGASFIAPNHSRYVVDLNRPPTNTPMYTGVNNTELCPTRFFTGEAIYKQDCEPSDEQIKQRVLDYWQPYHQALQGELARLKTEHGHAILWDGHSICSELPWLFEGRLPTLSFGTVDGTSCAPSLRSALEQKTATHQRFDFVFDGRFKGGYITRQYGNPAQNIHAVQLEMVWDCYMREQRPFQLDPERTQYLLPLLRELLVSCIEWQPAP